MWDEGHQKKSEPTVIPDYLMGLPDDITDQEARETVAMFLRDNLGWSFEMLAGGSTKLLAVQEIILNTLFKKDNNLVVAGRGFGKSFLIIVFCIVYAIFNPGKNICIIANNFRAAKRIFDGIEKVVNHKKSFLLRACFSSKPSRQPDSYKWVLPNGSTILALPLSNGEGLRGTRANVLIIDEALLISEEIQKAVLNPFLTARGDITDQMELNEVEDELIAAGKMTHADRTILSTNKLILMSSASYQFEYLYSGLWLPYLSYIQDEKQEKKAETDKEVTVKPSYAAMRMSYEVMPPRTIMDETAIEAAKAGGPNNPYFQREYQARFIDVSGSYFNIKNLHDCTYGLNHNPDFPIQLVGKKTEKYLLTIDPSYSQAKNSDFFGMGVYQLDSDTRRIIQVHTYAKAGGTLKEHHEYLTYLLSEFNIVYAVVDGNGTEFTDGYNESTIAKQHNFKLGYLPIDFEAENYDFEVRKARAKYNASNKTILYAQPFNAPAIQRMNEYMQGGINSKKIWFASSLGSNEHASAEAFRFNLPYVFKDKHGNTYNGENMQDFLDNQDDLIVVTKQQIASIEVKSGVTGILHFDLPIHLKKLTGDDRPRKDNYTCLMMAYYGSKHYFDITTTPKEDVENTFTPMFF